MLACAHRIRFNDLVPNEQVLLTCAALACRDEQWEAVPQFLSLIRQQGTDVTTDSFVTLFEFLHGLDVLLDLPDNTTSAEGLLGEAQRPDTRAASNSTQARDGLELLETFVSRLAAIAAQENVDIARVKEEILARDRDAA